MNALIVLAHPEPQSFNAGLKDVARDTLAARGYSVEVSDLYGQGFNPVEGAERYLDRANPKVFAPLAEQRNAWQTGRLPAEVRREVDRLERADLIILQFPLWWHAQPAILKGWFDRVFVSGGLYTSRMRYDRGYFRGKRAICSITSGAPAETFGPGRRGGDPDTMLWPIQYSLHYMGFSVVPPFLSFGIQGHGFSYQDEGGFGAHLEAQKAAWSRRLQCIEHDEPIPFPGWADWGEDGRPAAFAPVA